MVFFDFCVRQYFCLLAAVFALAIVHPGASSYAAEISKGSVTWGISWIGDGRDGALIIDIVPKGPADNLGLVPGDVISSVDGRPVKNSAELKEMIKNSRPYSLVRIVVRRFGERLEKNLLPTGVLRLEVKNLDRTYRSFNIPGVPKTVFTSPSTTLEALDNINVLQNVIIDRKSGQIAVMGIYDPKYATGPIPYLDLLKTALKFSAPKLNLVPEQTKAPPEASLVTDDLWSEILGMSLAERERQVLIREMATGYGLSREEFVRLYNYAYLDAQGDFAPAEIGRILVKAYRHLGSDREADAYERLTENTADDFRQALKILEREKEVEEFSGGKQLTKDQLLVFACIAMLQNLGMPSGEIRELLSKADTERIGPAEMLNRMYRYVALWLYDLASAKKTANQENKTVAASRPISRTGPKVGLVIVDPARIAASDQVFVRIQTTDIDANSRLTRIMYEADYAGKTLQARPDLFEKIPGFVTAEEYISKKYRELSSTKTFHLATRFWFNPRRIELQVSADKSLVSFGAAEMMLNTETVEGRTNLPDDEKRLIGFFKDFTKHVTDNYELYAQSMPAWHSLREAAKVIALARWLKQNGISVHLDGVQQEWWDNPGRVPAIWGRGFSYYLTTAGEFSHGTFEGVMIGGVTFKNQNWTSYGPASKTTETKVPDQLVMSSQLGQKAVQAASAGNLESARHLAELSAQALTGRLSRGELTKQNITLPSAQTAPISAPQVQLQKQLLKETHNQITALRQNPANAQATGNLSRINDVYDQVQSRPVLATEYLRNLQIRQALPTTATKAGSPTQAPAASQERPPAEVPKTPAASYDCSLCYDGLRRNILAKLDINPTRMLGTYVDGSISFYNNCKLKATKTCEVGDQFVEQLQLCDDHRADEGTYYGCIRRLICFGPEGVEQCSH